MTRLVVTLAFATLIPTPAAAQASDPTDATYWRLTAALFASALTDTATTFAAINASDGTVTEHNPVTRVFFERGPVVTYAAAIAWNTGVAALTAKWRREGRWYWWVGPAALVVTHTALACYNAWAGR